MSYDHDGAEYEDDHVDAPRFSFFTKLRDAFTRSSEDDEYYEDEPAHQPKQKVISSSHGSSVATVQPPIARVPAPTRYAGGSLNPVRRSATISQMRLEHERPQTVTVRRTVQSFEDVRRAVDGLREGVQQIVNIEQTPSDVAERLIDFLNGATYALDGSVEKIGTQVYLFTPSTITIDVEDKAKIPAKPFFDRE